MVRNESYPSSFGHIRTIVEEVSPVLGSYVLLKPQDVPKRVPDSLTRQRLEEKFGIATLLHDREEITEDQEHALAEGWTEKIKRHGNSGFSRTHERDTSYSRTTLVVSPLDERISVQMHSHKEISGEVVVAGLSLKQDGSYRLRVGQGWRTKLHGREFIFDASPSRDIPIVEFKNRRPLS